MIKFVTKSEERGERPVQIRVDTEINDDGSIDIVAHDDESGENWYVIRLNADGTASRFNISDQCGDIPFVLASDEGIKITKGAI